MLSYRHVFHAGNFADILKHLVLANTLHYAIRKDAPLLYLDTHAGAGMYRLNSASAQQTGEASAGILKLDFADLHKQLKKESSAALAVYELAIQPSLQRNEYPGSPLLAATILRRQDHLHLCELHSRDFEYLQNNFSKDARVHCAQTDGYQAISALIPPTQKRAVILIDPSYEIKSDYQQAVKTIAEIYKRMPTAQILFWYPVVQRSTTEKMIAALIRTGVKDLWRFELGVAPDNDNFGMTAAGMLVINPPWTLPAQIKSCLPLLQMKLAPATGNWHADNLVTE
jgi:23S rRNA (adenine2030-N6)-methyltransferase